MAICQLSRAYRRSEQYDLALAEANRAITLAPALAEPYARRSSAYIAKEQYQLAIDDSNKAIALDPKLALGYVGRAKAYEIFGNYQKEINDINMAIALEPKNYHNYILKATGLEGLGQHDKALEAIKISLSLMPKQPHPHTARGYLYGLAGNYQKAIPEFTAALKSNPQSSQVYLYRATAFAGLKQYRRALEDCNRGLSLNKKQSFLFIERGYINLCLGKLHNAVEDYTNAIKLAPKRTDGYTLRANAYNALGHYPKQIEDLTEAITISPQTASLYENRGTSYYHLGELEKAIADSKKAISLNPKSYFAHQIAAYAYNDLGLYDKAIEHCTKILEISKKHPLIWCNRAKLYQWLGKTEQATNDWRTAYQKLDARDRVYMYLSNPLIDYTSLAKTGSTENQLNKLKQQLKDKPVVLPLKTYQCSHMGVMVQVTGQKKELMLDTGCGNTNIWKHAVNGIGNLEKQKLLSTKANGKDVTTGFIRVRSLKLGSLDLHNVAISIDDVDVHRETMSGFLGGNILENFVVKVDYKNRALKLATNTSKEISNKTLTVPMILRGHCPYCVIQLDGKVQALALLDTGSPNSLTADSLVKPLLTKKMLFKGKTGGPWLGNLSSEEVKFKTLKVGGTNFESPRFDVFPAYQAPLAAESITLGNDFLGKFKSVTFDYPGRLIIFEL